MAVAANADDYTVGRVNLFFTANNNTSDDGNLTGQCVTLLKWFFAQMCDGFPSPFAARGDARYVGETLVNQGLAVEIPWDQRRRGDVICYEFGTYGHIALQLSGGRVFEENVNWPGTASKIVDGDYVHASRIGSEAEAWRASLNPHVYRINSYNEEGEKVMAKVTLAEARICAFFIGGDLTALDGGRDADLNANHVDKQEFDEAYLVNWYTSKEGQDHKARMEASQPTAPKVTVDGKEYVPKG